MLPPPRKAGRAGAQTGRFPLENVRFLAIGLWPEIGYREFCGLLKLDPNTHAIVLATAFFTSLFFALAAWIPVGLLLRWILL